MKPRETVPKLVQEFLGSSQRGDSTSHCQCLFALLKNIKIFSPVLGRGKVNEFLQSKEILSPLSKTRSEINAGGGAGRPGWKIMKKGGKYINKEAGKKKNKTIS